MATNFENETRLQKVCAKIEALDDAIMSGVFEIEEDGKKLRYRNDAALQAARSHALGLKAELETTLGATLTNPKRKHGVAYLGLPG